MAGTYIVRLDRLLGEHAETDRRHPGGGVDWRDARHRTHVWALVDAVGSADELDGDELRHVEWLAGQDVFTVAAAAALLDRARGVVGAPA